MKKVLLFIAITLPLLFTSCSSEKIENNPLLGTWEKMTDGDYEEIRFYHDLTVVRSVVDKDSKAITETRGDYVLKEDAIIVLKWTSERKKNPVTDKWSEPENKKNSITYSYTLNKSNLLYLTYKDMNGNLVKDTYTKK